MAPRYTWLRVSPLILCAAALLLGSGCAGRYVRMEQKGMTCTQALQSATGAIQKMGYTITGTAPPAPGNPGMVTGERVLAANVHRILVQVFCTSLGAEVAASVEGGLIDHLNFQSDFRAAFNEVAQARPPIRKIASVGVDVLVIPDRVTGNDLGIDFSGTGVLPVKVQIANNTTRSYRFESADLVLQQADGQRVHPFTLTELAARVSLPVADTGRLPSLQGGILAPQQTVSGYLYYPFGGYVRARFSLTDLESEETEGFWIEF